MGDTRDHRMFAKKGSVLVRSVGEEAILLCTESEIYFSLNEVGVIMFDRLSSGSSVAETAEHVVQMFDADPQRVESDVATLVADLLQRGILLQL